MPVKINIKTTIWQDGQREMIETTVPGYFYRKANADFLQYEEDGTRTTVKVTAAGALILRNGAIKMRLPFTLNKQMTGSFELSIGKMVPVTMAKRIEHVYHPESGSGSIDLLYDLSMQGDPHKGTFLLEISFQEEK